MSETKRILFAITGSLIMTSPVWFLMLRDHMKGRKLKCFFGHKELVLDFAFFPAYVISVCSTCGGKEVRHYPSQDYLDKLK